MTRARILGVLLVLASLVAVVQSWRTSSAQSDYVKCQARYNEINNERTRALTETAETERAAERRVQNAEANLWLNPAITRPRQAGQPVDPAILAAFNELRMALTAWRETTAAADARRLDHPVPPPPSELCG